MASVVRDFRLDDWRYARVGGYDVYTNAPSERIHESLIHLERFTELVGRFLFGPSFAEPRATILLFGEPDQFLLFSGSEFVGGHAVTARQQASLAMSAGSGGSVDDAILNHELVHIVMHSTERRRFPRWFGEGIAEFFGGVVVRDDVATYAQRVPGRVIELEFKKRTLPLSNLFDAGTSMQGDAGLYYATSWLFVHYGLLADQLGGPRRVEQFWKFVNLISQSEPWRRAYAAAFDVPLAQIEDELELHRQRVIEDRLMPLGNLLVERIDPEYDFQSISAADASRVLAGHAMRVSGRNRLASSFLDVILAESPGDASALHDRVRTAAYQRSFELADQLWGQLESLDSPAEDRILAQTRAILAHERYRALRSRDRRERGAAFLEVAQAGYREVLARDKGRYETWLRLGNTYVLDESGPPEPGIEAIRNALRMGIGFDMYARLDLAKLLVRAGDLDAARPHLDYIVASFGPFPEAEEARKLIRRHY